MPQPLLDPGHEADMRAAFARQSFMATLGARIVSVEPGLVTFGFGRQDSLLQQHGFLHAGVATAICDSACGFSAVTLAPRGSGVLTIEFKANFLRPAAGTSFEATGRVIKPGRQIMVCEGVVHDLDAPDKPVMTLSATMFIQPPAV